jgi:hypothetical protein
MLVGDSRRKAGLPVLDEGKARKGDKGDNKPGVEQAGRAALTYLSPDQRQTKQVATLAFFFSFSQSFFSCL